MKMSDLEQGVVSSPPDCLGPDYKDQVPDALPQRDITEASAAANEEIGPTFGEQEMEHRVLNPAVDQTHISLVNKTPINERTPELAVPVISADYEEKSFWHTRKCKVTIAAAACPSCGRSGHGCCCFCGSGRCGRGRPRVHQMQSPQ
jgi:hypothetical protein